MKNLLIFIALFTMLSASAQETDTTNFFPDIQNYDVSDLWTEKIVYIGPHALNDGFYEKAEPLGYIGYEYQRLHMHFISVIQNPFNRLEYFVYGKTKVKDNICTFQGTIRVTDAITYERTYRDNDSLAGIVYGDYEFYEDKDQYGTGIFKGTFESDFVIKTNNSIIYDASMFGADACRNNQFEGTWSSYNNNVKLPCNWGDLRIPNRGSLGGGAAFFYPNPKYLKNGWENYDKSIRGGEDDPVRLNAYEKEKEKWWLDID